MTRRAATFILACALTLALGAPPAGSKPAAGPKPVSEAAAGLASAERAFSALSVEKGMKDAFLAYLGEGAIIFHPGPVEGRPVWEARKNPPLGTLIWEPEYVEVSGSGDLGLSTGPWEYRPQGESNATKFASGHFITIWARSPEHGWRVMVDLGIDHGKPTRGGLGGGRLAEGPRHAPATVAARDRGEPAELDAALGRASRKGLRGGLSGLATRDLRFNRTGAEPALGLPAAVAAVDSLAGSWSFGTRGSGVASSGDFAYTYGLALRTLQGAGAVADTSVYLNVWRRDGHKPWRLSLAVLNPIR